MGHISDPVIVPVSEQQKRCRLHRQVAMPTVSQRASIA